MIETSIWETFTESKYDNKVDLKKKYLEDLENIIH